MPLPSSKRSATIDGASISSMVVVYLDNRTSSAIPNELRGTGRYSSSCYGLYKTLMWQSLIISEVSHLFTASLWEAGYRGRHRSCVRAGSRSRGDAELPSSVLRRVLPLLEDDGDLQRLAHTTTVAQRISMGCLTRGRPPSLPLFTSAFLGCTSSSSAAERRSIGLS